MRVHLLQDETAAEFSTQLLQIGDGKIQIDENSKKIKLPANFCNIVSTRNELIEKVFPNLQNNYLNHQWINQRAILAAKNIDVDTINLKIQSLINTPLHTFKSIDTVIDEDEGVNFPTVSKFFGNSRSCTS